MPTRAVARNASRDNRGFTKVTNVFSIACRAGWRVALNLLPFIVYLALLVMVIGVGR
jgi:hypothetical protein